MSEIDELSLKISVDDNGSASKISAVAASIKELHSSISSLRSIASDFSALSNMMSSLGKNIATPAVPKMPEMEVPDNAENIENLNEVINENSDAVKETATAYKKLNKEIDKNNKEQGKNQNNLKKSKSLMADLFKSVGRIAFYRAIRTALKEFVQSAQEGLANIRKTDDGLNKAMANISLSATSLKNSFGTMLSPIIQTIQPIITKLADGIANIVNRIEEAKAALAGEKSFTKILTSDSKEYQDQLEKTTKAIKEQEGALLSFDTFTTQSRKSSTDSYTGTTVASVTMDTSEASEVINKVKGITAAITGLVGAIGTLYALNLIKKISSFTKILSTAKKGTDEFTNATKNLDSATTALSVVAIASLATGITTLIANWNDMNTTAKALVPTLSVLAGVVAALASAFWIAKGNWVKALAIGATVTGVGLTIGSTLSTMSFANGGDFDTADLFYANENGNTELIASSNNGGGSVMNLDQWSSISYSSVYRALSDYNAAQNTNGNSLDINALGRTIAGNSGFVNEMNRRNSNLNLI